MGDSTGRGNLRRPANGSPTLRFTLKLNIHRYRKVKGEVGYIVTFPDVDATRMGKMELFARCLTKTEDLNLYPEDGVQHDGGLIRWQGNLKAKVIIYSAGIKV